jgi:hypothetical protein
MTTTFVTEGVSAYVDGISSTDKDAYLTLLVRKGRAWQRKAGVETRSDDLALLSHLLWRGMIELFREERLDDDYLVAGDVLDEFVTDHDAELLVEVVPEIARENTGEVGGMTTEATAVHTVLLRIVGEMREAWSKDDG